ncbi:unnamed protein product [Acanthoscelides obtectus]|nr:unnamed protein product [Acanthoscelides obtectus]CAK1639717.1 hypothetical protein AOBTE_LOCUS11328 [Acanthoscelides obtectus]
MNIKGFGVTEIRNKIRILRSTYSQELKKIKLSKMHGSTGLYIPNLKWFAEMNDFLKLNKTKGVTEMPSALLRIESNEANNEPPTISIKAIHSIKSEPITNDNSIDNSDDTFTEDGAYNDDIDESDFLLTEEDQDMFVMPKPKKAKIEGEDSPVHSPHSMNVTSREYEDEFDVFGRHVAAQLKQLSTSNSVRAQEKIQSILTTFRLQEIQEDD